MKEATKKPPIIVSIGIQARSTSKRFPGKVNQLVYKKTMLDHVIDSAMNAASYINHWNSKGILVDVALLVPAGDIIAQKRCHEVVVIEGSEPDVLSRYVLLQKNSRSDYIVRITADCPLLPPFIISKMITIAVMNEYDYVSNVDERFRTAPDGFDCEVFSKRLLDHTNIITKEPADREHVTTAMRRMPPPWVHHGTVINFLDLSDWKLSVDLPSDLEEVRAQYMKINRATTEAKKIFGKENVHKV